MGVAQIEQMDEILARKRRMGALYTELLKDVPGITLQGVRDWAHVNAQQLTLRLGGRLAAP